MRSVVRWLSLVTLILGAVLLLIAGAVYSYGAFEEYRFWQEWAAAGGSRPAYDEPAIDLGQSASSFETSQGQDSRQNDIEPTAALPTPTPQPWLKSSPATWIRIAKIDVDSPVVHAPVVNDEWQVPKFVVGHLEGTADLDDVGNIVLTGHVESLASGNVFAKLKEMAVDDAIVLFAGEDPVRYTVREVKVVKNDDLSVVARSANPVLTLLTCTGQWIQAVRDYSERLVIVARPDS